MNEAAETAGPHPALDPAPSPNGQSGRPHEAARDARRAAEAEPAPKPAPAPAQTPNGGPVRVLWLAKGLGLGGAERLLLNCARHADRSRYSIEVAYVLPWKDALAADLERAGITVHCLGGTPGHHRRDPLWPLRLRTLLETRGYHLVHTHMPVPAIAARLLLPRSSGVRVVHTEHNVWPRYRLPTRLANAATYRRNDAVIAVSHAVARSIPPKRRGAGRPAGAAAQAAAQAREATARAQAQDGWLTVVHHGPDLVGAPQGAQARAAARSALGVPQSAVVIGTVGNFTPKKDQLTLLKAHALLRRNHPEAVLVLIGSGPLERQLRAQSAELRLRRSVVFAGSRPDVPALLPAFDVFALSSRQEGLPVALMEAMASGLPCVLTRVGGMPEVVDDGAQGLLVPPGDAEALAVALGRLVRGTALRARMSAAARERSRGLDAAGAQRTIEGVYERVLAARPAAENPA